MKTALRTVLLLSPCLLLAACSHSDDDSQAEEARVRVVGQAPGSTPFVANLTLSLDDFAHLSSVSYTIAARPGTFSKPMSTTFTRAWIERTGAWRAADRRLVIPVFGPGITRDFSTPSRYAIDEKKRTAAEVWTYAPEPPIYSDVCSSTYETTPGNYLIGYAAAAGRTRSKLRAINSSGQIAFDYEYPTMNCGTVFIAEPIGFTGLVLK